MADEQFGFIGLGNIGQLMARHVKEAGDDLVVHDLAGTAERAPVGAGIAQSNSEVATEGTPNTAIGKAFKTIAAFSDEDPRQDKAEIYGFIRGRN